ncbi:MAG: hypothetical protein JNM20_16240 [Rhizobiales bacterium]|nr:hypothetical protein [Hyphomicrobiales bacterium]
MKSGTLRPIWNAVIVGVLVIAFLWLMNSWGQQFQALPLSSPSPGEVGKALLGFLLISLFVERAIQVYKNVWREPGKTERLQKVRATSTAIEVKTRAIGSEAEPKSKAALGEVRQLAEQKVDAVRDLDAYRSQTREQATWGGVLLGLVIALCGVRALDVFVVDHAPLKPEFWQYYLFGAVDVLVTGALIGGGADGIHRIISVFTTYADETKKQMEGQAGE